MDKNELEEFLMMHITRLETPINSNRGEWNSAIAEGALSYMTPDGRGDSREAIGVAVSVSIIKEADKPARVREWTAYIGCSRINNDGDAAINSIAAHGNKLSASRARAFLNEDTRKLLTEGKYRD